MIGLNLSYSYLQWHPPTSPPSPPAEGIERLFVPTPQGELELLHAPAQHTSSAPSSQHRSHAPLFFLHGGMGSAWVWTEYLRFFASHGISCYALSLRAHGESWYPGYWRMVFGTSKRELADDAVMGIRYVQEKEGEEVVLVGHSSGGGLVQYVLGEGDVRVKGLVLAAAVPGGGSMSVYLNWWKLDPWFTLRLIFHGYHPNSPLSTPTLVKRVFFSDDIPTPYLLDFMTHGSAYESYQWPFTMMRQFTTAQKVLGQIDEWHNNCGGKQRERVLILAGEVDKIMTEPVMTRLARWYRDGYVKMVEGKKLDGVITAKGGEDARVLEKTDSTVDNAGQGVRLCVVPNAGHHLQNDVTWKIGAEKLLAFYEQL